MKLWFRVQSKKALNQWPIESKICQFLTFAEDLSIASWPAASSSCRFCLAGYPGYSDLDAKNKKSSNDEYKIAANICTRSEDMQRFRLPFGTDVK